MPQQTKSDQTFDIDKARQLIIEERKERATACWKEISKTLEKHNCTLDGRPEFVPSPTGFVVHVNVFVQPSDTPSE